MNDKLLVKCVAQSLVRAHREVILSAQQWYRYGRYVTVICFTVKKEEEASNLEKLNKPIPNANIHAAVTMLSPVKKGKDSLFFDGTISYGTSKMRIVGFSPEHQKKLLSFQEKKMPINIVNCEVKPSRQDETKC